MASSIGENELLQEMRGDGSLTEARAGLRKGGGAAVAAVMFLFAMGSMCPAIKERIPDESFGWALSMVRAMAGAETDEARLAILEEDFCPYEAHISEYVRVLNELDAVQ